MIQQLADGILWLSWPSCCVVGSNTAVQRLLGYDEQELLAQTLYTLVAYPRPVVERYIEQVMAHHQYALGEQRYRHKDGRMIDVEVSLTLVTQEQNLFLCVVVRDITQRKQAEVERTQQAAQLEQQVQQRTIQLRQLLSYEAMLKRITDKVRDSLDEHHILQTAVQELAMLLGVECCNTGLYNADFTLCTVVYDYTLSTAALKQGNAVLMSDCPDIYSQLLRCQPVQCCLDAALSRVPLSDGMILACPVFDNQGVLGDLWLCRQHQDPFDDLEVRLVQQVANQCAIAIRQARLYQTVQNQLKASEHLNSLKDDFLSSISHELRTPISNIKLAVQMLTLMLGREGLLPSGATEASVSATKVVHYLKILHDECNREISLITDLLELQHSDASTPAVTIQPIQLHSYLQRILAPFKEQIETAHQHLNVDVPPTLPPLISDAQRLERILVEL